MKADPQIVDKAVLAPNGCRYLCLRNICRLIGKSAPGLRVMLTNFRTMYGIDIAIMKVPGGNGSGKFVDMRIVEKLQDIPMTRIGAGEERWAREVLKPVVDTVNAELESAFVDAAEAK
jgi:hypothetical protein